MQFYHRFGNICKQQLKNPKELDIIFDVTQFLRLKLGKNLEL